MSIEAMVSRPCTVQHLTPGDVDEFNDEVPEAYDAPQPAFCYYEQRQADEDTVLRDGQRDEMLFLLRPATLVADGRDQITVDGIEYEIHGPVRKVLNPRTQTFSHLECIAWRTT